MIVPRGEDIVLNRCEGSSSEGETMRKAVLVRACLVLTILLFAAALSAQVPTGKIFGTVTDEQGTPLPGVAVEATSAQLVGKAAAVTEPNGVYRLFALTPGTYKITFTLTGFKPLTRDGIVVALEQTVKLDVGLELGAIEEQVTVVGQTPLIDVKTTVKGMTMTREIFQILPRGRDFDSLIAAVPGVANEPMLAGFSVDGASGLENMFYVDGTDISNTWTGARGENVAFEFVDEVQVKASGYQAEFGGAMGGVVNVITRQGGNAYHGELLGYYSGSALNGKERDTLRYNPYDIYEGRIRQLPGPLRQGQSRPHRGRVQPGRVHLQGQAVVFRVFSPRLSEHDAPRRLRQRPFRREIIPRNINTGTSRPSSRPSRSSSCGWARASSITSISTRARCRTGTGRATRPISGRITGSAIPGGRPPRYADLTLGNNLLVSFRGGSYYTNTTDQQVQPQGPRYYMAGTGPSVFPDIPAEYRKPFGWSNYRSITCDGAIHPAEVPCRRRCHLFPQPGRRACLEIRGLLDPPGRRRAATAISIRPVLISDLPGTVRSSWAESTIGRGKYGYYQVRGNETTGPVGHVL